MSSPAPPALKLKDGQELTVRLVRTLKTPVAGEECYRVLVDQLPGAEQNGIAVQFIFRHSVPLCFDAPEQKPGGVEWSLTRQGGSLVLSGFNAGQRRVIASGVTLAAKGASANVGTAVVLGGSTMSWPVKGKLKAFQPGTSFTLKATINGKAVNVEGKVGGG